MHELDNHQRLCAETSSIWSILNEGILDEKKNLYLLTSDTADGRKVSEVLKLYFQPVFQRVLPFSIENLDGSSPERFKEDGLRNLVKLVVQAVKSLPKQEACVINATGGYKAQISFAGLIGQVMQIPVYYQFEDFSSVVQLPEMPVTFDYKLWLKHFTLFRNLFELGVMSEKLLPKDMDITELKGLIEPSGGQIRLSSVGLLMHEVLWSRFAKEGALYLPSAPADEDECIIEGIADVLPLSLQTVLESINALPFIKRIIIEKVKRGVSGPMTFQISQKPGYIEGTYSQNDQMWHFQMETTATDEIGLNAACVELYQRFEPLTQRQKNSSIEFILVRHGQHIGEHEGRIEGWANFELTETGHRQSQLVAERLKKDFPKIDVLYCSSLSRARETAEHVGKEAGLTPTVLDDLRAMNYGKPGGLTKDEAAVLYPFAYKSTIFNRTYEGESELDFSRRVMELFYELVHNHQGQTVLRCVNSAEHLATFNKKV